MNCAPTFCFASEPLVLQNATFLERVPAIAVARASCPLAVIRTFGLHRKWSLSLAYSSVISGQTWRAGRPRYIAFSDSPANHNAGKMPAFHIFVIAASESQEIQRLLAFESGYRGWIFVICRVKHRLAVFIPIVSLFELSNHFRRIF